MMSATYVQSGVVEIGSSAEMSKAVTLAFPETFEAPPVVVANTLRDDGPETACDVHVVSFETVSASEAGLQVQRVDAADAWTHDTHLSWLAIGTAAAAAGPSAWQRGVVTVGPSPRATASAFVMFSRAFDAPPVLVVSNLQDPELDDIPDVFAVSIRTVSTCRAVVDVRRVDGDEGWGQSLRLTWVAAGEADFTGGVGSMDLGTGFTVVPSIT
jgi:hypothetical protein